MSQVHWDPRHDFGGFGSASINDSLISNRPRADCELAEKVAGEEVGVQNVSSTELLSAWVLSPPGAPPSSLPRWEPMWGARKSANVTGLLPSRLRSL
eukprot:15436042-Alexandrium_andersonii.AAC.1